MKKPFIKLLDQLLFLQSYQNRVLSDDDKLVFLSLVEFLRPLIIDILSEWHLGHNLDDQCASLLVEFLFLVRKAVCIKPKDLPQSFFDRMFQLIPKLIPYLR